MDAKSVSLADLTFRRYCGADWRVWGNSSMRWTEVQFEGCVDRLGWPPMVDVDDFDPEGRPLDPLCDRRPPMPPLRDVDADDSSDTVLESKIDEDEILDNLDFVEIELAKEGGACFHDIVLPSRIQRRVDVNQGSEVKESRAHVQIYP